VTWRGVVASSLLVGLVPSGPLAAQCPDGTPPPCGPARVARAPAGIPVDSNALAVLPFHTSGASTDVAWLGEGMVDLLSIALDGFAGWRTVHPRTVLARVGGDRAAGDVAAAARTARAAGAATMVLGSAVAVGPQLRLRAELYDAVRLRRLAAVDASGSLANPGPVVDSVAVGLARERLGRTGLAGRRSPHEYATTSPQALRAFLAAERLVRQGAMQVAAESLLRAIALDSTFGLAYYRLYVVGTYGGFAPGIGLADIARIARDGLRRGATLPGRQRDLLAAVDAMWRGLVADALERSDDLGRRYPDDAEAAYGQGEAYYHLGILAGEQRERALAAFERGIALDPGQVEPYNHAIELRAALGDTAGARGLLGQLRRIAPAFIVGQALDLLFRTAWDGARPHAALGAIGVVDTAAVLVRAQLEALRAFDLEPARAVALADTLAAIAQQPGKPPTQRADALRSRAVYRITQGRFREATAFLAEADRMVPGPVEDLRPYALLALVRGTVGDTVIATVRWLAARPGTDDRLAAAQMLAWSAAVTGDTSATEALRQPFPVDFPEYREALSEAVRGMAAGRRGDAASARGHLAAAGIITYVATISGVPDPGLRFALELARLERAAGNLATAARRLARRSFATGIVLMRADAEELLGQIAEQRGDTTTAIRAYRNFVALWADADPELQPRIAAARAALARLER
jgi:tetratricopeptide (TPR) repeat protein